MTFWFRIQSTMRPGAGRSRPRHQGSGAHYRSMQYRAKKQWQEEQNTTDRHGGIKHPTGFIPDIVVFVIDCL